MGFYNVFLARLSPNDWGLLVSFLILWFKSGNDSSPSIREFASLFQLKSSPSVGFLYFAKRAKAKLLVSGLPSSNKGWKPRFFFVKGDSWELSGELGDIPRVPRVWGALRNTSKADFLCASLLGLHLVV